MPELEPEPANEQPATPFQQAAEAANAFEQSSQGQPAADQSPAIEWTASEFIAHEKGPLWYGVLAVCTFGLAALLYLITRDFVSCGVAVVAGLILGIYAGQKPHQVKYLLDTHGIAIGNRHYSYTDFRSFAVLSEEAFSSIVFMPLKRFSPPISLYYAPEHEDDIVTLLTDQLPFEHRKPDAIDNFLRRIRF